AGGSGGDVRAGCGKPAEPGGGADNPRRGRVRWRDRRRARGGWVAGGAVFERTRRAADADGEAAGARVAVPAAGGPGGDHGSAPVRGDAGRGSADGQGARRGGRGRAGCGADGGEGWAGEG